MKYGDYLEYGLLGTQNIRKALLEGVQNAPQLPHIDSRCVTSDTIGFNCDVESTQQIIEEVNNSMAGPQMINNPIAKAARKATEQLRQQLILGESTNFKEENKMYKCDLNTILKDKEWIDITVNLEKFSERGFTITVSMHGDNKKEFVGYGEDVGKHISDLISEFVEDIEEKQSKQEEIEWLEDKIENFQAELTRLKK